MPRLEVTDYKRDNCCETVVGRSGRLLPYRGSFLPCQRRRSAADGGGRACLTASGHTTVQPRRGVAVTRASEMTPRGRQTCPPFAYNSPVLPSTMRFALKKHTLVMWLVAAATAVQMSPLVAAQGKSSTAKAGRLTESDLATAKPGRDPNQPIDEEYTKKIKEYTTETFFLSPLVDYLPASKTRADAEGRAGRHRRCARQAALFEGGLRLHAAAGEIHAAREGVLDRDDRGGARDDRRRGRLRGADGEARREHAPTWRSWPIRARSRWTTRLADKIARRAAPVYYITGTIHSTEAGAPTALMELAYRLAVDDSRVTSATSAST